MSGHPQGSVVGRIAIAPIAAALAVCLVLLALSWPTLVARPRQVPVAITGQAQLVQQVRAAVGRQAADAVRLVGVSDRAAAVSAIHRRDVVGAIVLDPAHPQVLTASAGGAAGQQVMTQLLTGLQQGPHTIPFKITDVVPYAAGDPTGNRFTVAGLPLALGGVLGGVLLSTALGGALRRLAPLLAGLTAYSLLAGFGLAAILGPWYGALPGPYTISALAIALVTGALAGVVAGLRRLIGLPGFPVAAVLFILGATPISGATVPRELLPDFWGDVGQLLPQGAGNTLLRDLNYFPDAPILVPWLVAAGWAVIALGLIMVSRRRAGSAEPAQQRDAEREQAGDRVSDDHQGVPAAPDGLAGQGPRQA